MEKHRLLSLAEISLLARVRRPVASMWRSRHAARRHPFPAPAQMLDGQHLFDCGEVVAWLEVTGLGNNPQAREDSVAFSIPASEVVSDPVAFAGLTALITLRGATGPFPADEEETLLDRAESFDGNDELLLAEIEVLGSRLLPLARYAELLVAGSFDPAEPFDALVHRRAATTNQPPMPPVLRRFVAQTAVAVADEAGFARPTYVVRRVEDLDLLIEAAALVERRGAVTAALTLTRAESGSAKARLARRWLHVHGIAQSEIEVDTEGAYALPDEGVLVLRLPAAHPDRTADLAEVSNLCLNLSLLNRAVVVGPAATLTDPLLQPRRPGRPPAEGTDLSAAGVNRADALRTGAVRAVVRLPPGLIAEQSRARAAVWCLGPSRSPSPVTLCADLPGTLDAARAEDLVTDLVAAMRGPRTEVARQLRSARFRPTTELVLSTGALVEPTVREVQLGPARVLVQLQDLLDRVAADVPGCARPEVTASTEATGLPRVTLAEAVRQHGLHLLSGARVDSAALSPGAEVPVVRHPADLARRTQLAGLSLLELATTYPHVSLTEPGDLVVTSVGGPAASVDRRGGAVVAYPARILRCHRPREASPQERADLTARGIYPADLRPQTFTPEAVAADIDALPTDATRWEAWPITVVPTDQLRELESVLTQLAERRARLEAARSETDRAIQAITQAVGARVCTVGPLGPTRSGRTVA